MSTRSFSSSIRVYACHKWTKKGEQISLWSFFLNFSELSLYEKTAHALMNVDLGRGRCHGPRNSGVRQARHKSEFVSSRRP